MSIRTRIKEIKHLRNKYLICVLEELEFVNKKKMNNREIKFRVWDEKYKKWIKNACIDCDTGVIVTPLKGSDSNIDSEFRVMQFTGLTDKNNKEIYEGDILSWENDSCPEYHGKIFNPFEVIFDSMCGSFVCFWRNRDYKETFDSPYTIYEVIGNIFENSNLMGINLEKDKLKGPEIKSSLEATLPHNPKRSYDLNPKNPYE